MEPALELLAEAHGDNLNFVFRHFPLTSIHDKAVITAEATEAAGAQGAFWEMHDLIFERQSEWSGSPLDQMPAILTNYAAELGLDTTLFAADLENHTYEDKVTSQYNDASAMQLGGTPTFIANGYLFPSSQWGLSYQALDAFVWFMRLESVQYESPPPSVVDPASEYYVTIQTEKGDITVELYPQHAPTNVNSFVFLAQDGWYDGITFHRVVPDFVAQAGDPTQMGFGNPGYQCGDEISSELSFNNEGVVGIANSGPDTGSSQFFITLAPQPNLDGGYTIIGQVVDGLDVLQSLSARDPQDPNAAQGDVIETIVIEER